MLTSKFEALLKLWPGLKGPQAINCNVSRLYLLGSLCSLVHTRECEGYNQERAPKFPPGYRFAACKPPKFTLGNTLLHSQLEEPEGGRATRCGPAPRGLLQEQPVSQPRAKGDPLASFWTAAQRRQLPLFNKQGSSNLGGISFQLKLCMSISVKRCTQTLLRCFAVRTLIF